MLMYGLKMPAKYWDVVSTWSGPLGLRATEGVTDNGVRVGAAERTLIDDWLIDLSLHLRLSASGQRINIIMLTSFSLSFFA